MSKTPVVNVLKSIALNRIGRIQYPSFVTFFVTWACNHRCVFCDVWKKTPKDELSVSEIERIFRQLRKLDVLRISGGEPFVRKDLAEIVNLIDQINDPAMIHFTTNGINTRRIVDTLQSIKSKSKIHIKVSIDDVGERHDRVRGVKGAYDKAIETVNALVELRDKSGIYVGVNQAILDETSMEAYAQLKGILGQLKVPVYASIAYDSSSTLYSENPQTKDRIDPDSSFRPFGKWSGNKLAETIRMLSEDNKQTNSYKEQLVDNYFMNGLFERLVEERRHARGPSCVALNNHLRLLPNGDVPICLYNGTVVGNLREQSFDDVWYGDAIKPHRKWVADCSGCWSSCETAVSAIYTGDIVKGIRRKF